MQLYSDSEKPDYHLKNNCCLFSIQAAVMQMIILLSIFLSNNNPGICLAIYNQIWEWPCEPLDTGEVISNSLIETIVTRKFPDNVGNGDIVLTNLLKMISRIIIRIDGRETKLNSISIDITNGSLCYGFDPENQNRISIFDITSPFDYDFKFNLVLSTFAWVNFYKRASNQYDMYAPVYLNNVRTDAKKLFFYLAIRFWDRDALCKLRDDGSNINGIEFRTFFLDQFNIKKIGEREPIYGSSTEILKLCDIQSSFPKYFLENAMSHLIAIRNCAMQFFGINYENTMITNTIVEAQAVIGNIQLERQTETHTHETSTQIKNTNRKSLQIFLTGVIAFLGLGAAAYLLLGNFLFNKILPFCELKNYIFTGIVGALSIFLIVTSIIRSYDLYKYLPNGIANSNCVWRFFKPLVDVDLQEQNIKRDKIV